MRLFTVAFLAVPAAALRYWPEYPPDPSPNLPSNIHFNEAGNIITVDPPDDDPNPFWPGPIPDYYMPSGPYVSDFLPLPVPPEPVPAPRPPVPSPDLKINIPIPKIKNFKVNVPTPQVTISTVHSKMASSTIKITRATAVSHHHDKSHINPVTHPDYVPHLKGIKHSNLDPMVPQEAPPRSVADGISEALCRGRPVKRGLSDDDDTPTPTTCRQHKRLADGTAEIIINAIVDKAGLLAPETITLAREEFDDDVVEIIVDTVADEVGKFETIRDNAPTTTTTAALQARSAEDGVDFLVDGILEKIQDKIQVKIQQRIENWREARRQRKHQQQQQKKKRDLFETPVDVAVSHEKRSVEDLVEAVVNVVLEKVVGIFHKKHHSEEDAKKEETVSDEDVKGWLAEKARRKQQKKQEKKERKQMSKASKASKTLAKEATTTAAAAAAAATTASTTTTCSCAAASAATTACDCARARAPVQARAEPRDVWEWIEYAREEVSPERPVVETSTEPGQVHPTRPVIVGGTADAAVPVHPTRPALVKPTTFVTQTRRSTDGLRSDVDPATVASTGASEQAATASTGASEKAATASTDASEQAAPATHPHITRRADLPWTLPMDLLDLDEFAYAKSDTWTHTTSSESCDATHSVTTSLSGTGTTHFKNLVNRLFGWNIQLEAKTAAGEFIFDVEKDEKDTSEEKESSSEQDEKDETNEQDEKDETDEEEPPAATPDDEAVQVVGATHLKSTRTSNTIQIVADMLKDSEKVRRVLRFRVPKRLSRNKVPQKIVVTKDGEIVLVEKKGQN